MGLFARFRQGPRSRVHMRLSVDEFVAGEQYDLPVELADRFIVRGYAEGNLSRAYGKDELRDMHANHQVVSL